MNEKEIKDGLISTLDTIAYTATAAKVAIENNEDMLVLLDNVIEVHKTYHSIFVYARSALLDQKNEHDSDIPEPT